MNINTYTNPTETRNIVEEVLDAAREAVVSTMGPNGKLACIIEINEPIVTKDGVRVAKSLDFNDPRKNSIAKLITSAAIRTDDIVGDGTTTTTLMIHELYNKFSPYNNFLDMKFIDEKIKEVKEFLLSKVNIIDTKSDIFKKMLYTTSNYNSEIAETVIKIFDEHKAPNIKLIKGEHHKEDTVVVDKNIKFEGSYLSTDLSPRTLRGKCEFDNYLCFIIDGNVTSMSTDLENHLMGLMSIAPVLLIVRNMDPEVINRIVGLNMFFNNTYNGGRNVLNIIPFRLNAGGSLGSDIFSDLADVMDVHKTNNIETIKNISLDIKPIKNPVSLEVTFLELSSELDVYKDRVKPIVERLESLYESMSVSERATVLAQHTYHRLSRLRAQNVTLFVSGTTTPELSERYYLYEDVVKAAASSLTYGVIPGIGYGYNEAAIMLYEKYLSNDVLGDTHKEELLFCLCDVLMSQYNFLYNENVSLRDELVNLVYIDLVTGEESTVPNNVYDNGAAAISALEGGWSVTKRLINLNTIQGKANYSYGM